MTPANVDRFIRLVNEARQEPHGTMLVITEAAAAEAERLKTQATPLSPCELTPSLLRSLTPIDGGLLIDPSGICHAIGVILDGMATDRGNPGRGARFNSALRYVESSEAPCLAIVLSEDGGIDLVPDLRPALKRSEIDAAIAALTEIRDAEQINRSSYADLVEWLGQRRFYLRQEDCNNVNSLVKEIDRRLDSEDPGNLKIIRQPLVPHPDMDEELYLIPE